ncbi:MAG: carbohydrate kinase [Bacteroidetes bacterium]|nr:carbohydrate kinase [Bacteroidota bacterium]
MKKVLCIGEMLIDMICTDKGKALSEGENFIKKAGGAPANVAAAIAVLGGNAELAAKVGTDPFGRYLVEVMQSFGVSVKYVIQDPHHFTSFAFVSLMISGERDFYFNRGADGQLHNTEVEAIDISEYSIVHFGSATAFMPGPLQAAYQSLLKKCLQSDEVLISFDPNYRHFLYQNTPRSFIDQAWNFLSHCHFFKLSEEEAMLLTGAFNIKDAAAVLMKKTNAVFAITLGKEGALLACRGETGIVHGIDVKAVDATGAGDAFVGAVLYQLSGKTLNQIRMMPTKQWGEIIFNANKAGARTCQYLGAMEAYQNLSSNIFE